MVCIVKAMVFLVVMCGCESWTIKKAEHRRIDAFKLWCWRSKEIRQVNLKGNQPCIFIGGIGAEALIFCTPDTKNNSLEKDPDDRKD